MEWIGKIKWLGEKSINQIKTSTLGIFFFFFFHDVRSPNSWDFGQWGCFSKCTVRKVAVFETDFFLPIQWCGKETWIFFSCHWQETRTLKLCFSIWRDTGFRLHVQESARRPSLHPGMDGMVVLSLDGHQGERHHRLSTLWNEGHLLQWVILDNRLFHANSNSLAITLTARHWRQVLQKTF